MATVCVGCGLTVVEGKLAIETPETIHATVGSGTLHYPGPTDVSADTPILVGPELSVEVTNPSSCRDMFLNVSATFAAWFQLGQGAALIRLMPAGASEPFPVPAIGMSQTTGSVELSGVVEDAVRRVGIDTLAPGETKTYIGQAEINAPTDGNIPLDGAGALSVRVPSFLWSIGITGWLV